VVGAHSVGRATTSAYMVGEKVGAPGAPMMIYAIGSSDRLRIRGRACSWKRFGTQCWIHPVPEHLLYRKRKKKPIENGNTDDKGILKPVSLCPFIVFSRQNAYNEAAANNHGGIQDNGDAQSQFGQAIVFPSVVQHERPDDDEQDASPVDVKRNRKNA